MVIVIIVIIIIIANNSYMYMKKVWSTFNLFSRSCISTSPLLSCSIQTICKQKITDGGGNQTPQTKMLNIQIWEPMYFMCIFSVFLISPAHSHLVRVLENNFCVSDVCRQAVRQLWKEEKTWLKGWMEKKKLVQIHIVLVSSFLGTYTVVLYMYNIWQYYTEGISTC